MTILLSTMPGVFPRVNTLGFRWLPMIYRQNWVAGMRKAPASPDPVARPESDIACVDIETGNGDMLFKWSKRDNPAALEKAQAAAAARVAILKEFREANPGRLIADYDLPCVGRWAIGENGANVGAGDASQEYRKARQDWNEKVLLPIVEAVDVLMPSNYDPYDNGGAAAQDDVAYLREKNIEAKRLGSLVGGRPVAGFAWQRSHNNGNPGPLMGNQSFATNQIAALRGIADGVVLWSADFLIVHNATKPTLEMLMGNALEMLVGGDPEVEARAKAIAHQESARALCVTDYYAPLGLPVPNASLDPDEDEWPSQKQALQDFYTQRSIAACAIARSILR